MVMDRAANASVHVTCAVINSESAPAYHAHKVRIEHLEQELDEHWLVLRHQLVAL